ncbi:MAG: ECF transporter S component [Clostridia bacterium]|nr:ECF transporter S component [Clostridia bacterium]
MERKTDTRSLVLYALFIALIFLLGLTPVGYIMLPLAAITTVHIPVIIGGYVFGPKGGSLLGFFFGLTSLIRCFTTPDATAAIVLGTGTGFSFYNLLLILAIIFLPRILTGLFSAMIYKGLEKTGKDVLAMSVSAFAGSLTNTVFFLGGLYVLAFDQTAAAFGVPGEALLKAILGVVALNGVLEAVAAVILCCAVGKALKFMLARR